MNFQKIRNLIPRIKHNFHFFSNFVPTFAVITQTDSMYCQVCHLPAAQCLCLPTEREDASARRLHATHSPVRAMLDAPQCPPAPTKRRIRPTTMKNSHFVEPQVGITGQPRLLTRLEPPRENPFHPERLSQEAVIPHWLETEMSYPGVTQTQYHRTIPEKSETCAGRFSFLSLSPETTQYVNCSPVSSLGSPLPMLDLEWNNVPPLDESIFKDTHTSEPKQQRVLSESFSERKWDSPEVSSTAKDLQCKTSTTAGKKDVTMKPVTSLQCLMEAALEAREAENKGCPRSSRSSTRGVGLPTYLTTVDYPINSSKWPRSWLPTTQAVKQAQMQSSSIGFTEPLVQVNQASQGISARETSILHQLQNSGRDTTARPSSCSMTSEEISASSTSCSNCLTSTHSEWKSKEDPDNCGLLQSSSQHHTIQSQCGLTEPPKTWNNLPGGATTSSNSSNPMSLKRPRPDTPHPEEWSMDTKPSKVACLPRKTVRRELNQSQKLHLGIPQEERATVTIWKQKPEKLLL